MSEHTKTPWKMYEGENGPIAIVSGEAQPGKRWVIARVDSPVSSFPVELQRANADHILTCVNSHEALVEALTSIANNTCCGPCQEAALVAQAALASYYVKELGIKFTAKPLSPPQAKDEGKETP